MWLASPTPLQTPHPDTHPKLLYPRLRPSQPYASLFTEPDGTDDNTYASIRAGTKGFGVITWDAVRDATGWDPSLQLLLHYICSGFPTSHQSLPAEVQEYWQYRDRLSAVDEVLMMHSHILVPPELRQDALAALHAAHQGVSSMQNRAQASVFWPGSSGDLDTVCRECAICNQITPSQTALSPAEPVTPSYTFQAIDANHFTVHGTKYLVIVDRFSEWPHIMRATKSDEALGTQGLIRNLKFIFASCGAPDKLSSDGGPEFTADQTHAFLERWGVTHRLSSAYNPTSNGRASQHKGNFMAEFPLDSAAYLVRVRCLADV